ATSVHPSDKLCAIRAVAEFVSRQSGAGVPPATGSSRPRTAQPRGRDAPSGRRDAHPTAFTIRDLLIAMIKAHEIQGILALENSFNRVGLDHVLLVRVASAAVATQLLGGSREHIQNAV